MMSLGAPAPANWLSHRLQNQPGEGHACAEADGLPLFPLEDAKCSPDRMW